MDVRWVVIVNGRGRLCSIYVDKGSNGSEGMGGGWYGEMLGSMHTEREVRWAYPGGVVLEDDVDFLS